MLQPLCLDVSLYALSIHPGAIRHAVPAIAYYIAYQGYHPLVEAWLHYTLDSHIV
jgi:hypothetical protein